MKKIISPILALAFLLSFCVIFTFASEKTVDNAELTTEQVTTDDFETTTAPETTGEFESTTAPETTTYMETTTMPTTGETTTGDYESTTVIITTSVALPTLDDILALLNSDAFKDQLEELKAILLEIGNDPDKINELTDELFAKIEAETGISVDDLRALFSDAEIFNWYATIYMPAVPTTAATTVPETAVTVLPQTGGESTVPATTQTIKPASTTVMVSTTAAPQTTRLPKTGSAVSGIAVITVLCLAAVAAIAAVVNRKEKS